MGCRRGPPAFIGTLFTNLTSAGSVVFTVRNIDRDEASSRDTDNTARTRPAVASSRLSLAPAALAPKKPRIGRQNIHIDRAKQPTCDQPAGQMTPPGWEVF